MPIQANTTEFSIYATDFKHMEPIPTEYTCEGNDLSPELKWDNIPDGAESLVLIVDDPDAPDPDAPKMTWVHWVLYNIPTTSMGLGKNISPAQLPTGTKEGLNDWKKTGYGGPCPPIGVHRYFHKLYALNSMLPGMENPTKDELLKVMEPHIIDITEIIGTYIKEGNK